MMKSFALALLVFFVSLFPFKASAATTVTYAQAMASCTNTLPLYSGSPGVHCVDTSSGNSCGVSLEYSNNSIASTWPYVCGTQPNGCTQGQVVPPGTQVNHFASTGETCLGTCSIVLNAGVFSGGSWSGGGNYVESGASCASTGAATSQPKLTVPSDTTNADGSRTSCDPISGKCVTYNLPSQTVPAPPSSSGNHVTDSNSVTSNPATSSSTTSTSTTTMTGDGSGGSGSGSGGGTSTTTGQSTTSDPASSSSTASKCTTGVCDVGDADGDTGGLYQASTDTPASVYANFQSQVSNAPIVSAVTGFFSVTAAGSCPSWHIPGNKYWGAAGFDFTFFCSSDMLALMAAGGYVVLAMAAFCATRIAIY